MATEIERRFLVRDPRAVLTVGMTRWQRIRQGYFGRVEGLRIRVRIVTEGAGKRSAVLTLKGPRRGLSRLEYEYPLALDRARHDLDRLPSAQIICKIRYEMRHEDGLLWLVDRFLGPNTWLVLAEVELADPNQPVALPSWVGEEVTLDRRYGNSSLARWPMPLAKAA